MAEYTYVSNLDEAEHTSTIVLRDGGLELKQGSWADLTAQEYAVLKNRYNLIPGRHGQVTTGTSKSPVSLNQLADVNITGPELEDRLAQLEGVSLIGGIPTDRLIAEVLDGIERIVGNLNVTTYGAPGDGSMWLWSDGGLGTFRPTDIYNFNFVDYADGFTVTYRPHPRTPNDRTEWVPYSSSFTPMSDDAAAALVTHVHETKAQNVDRNSYRPSDEELDAFHAAQSDNPYNNYVTGRPGLVNPSTDDLIQWATHKWGITTDLGRAEAHLESKHSMDMLGDRFTQDDESQYLAAPAYARVPGIGVLDVYESLGIMQLRWHPAHAGGEGNPHPGTDPLRWQSTAFNLDYWGATVRGYLDNPGNWRSNWAVPGDTYVPGDYWKSVGSWFLPLPWTGNTAMANYIANVQARMESRPWTVADFSNVAADIKLLRQPLLVRSEFGHVLEHPRPVEIPYVPPVVPNAPTGLGITPGSTTLTLNWTDPTDDGGLPLLGFVIREVNEGWEIDTGAVNVRPYTLTGLTNGQSQTFEVLAYNDVGRGPASNQATGTPAAATAPGVPLNLSVTPGNAQVTVDWDPPASNGGSAITSYSITPKIAGVAQSPISTGSSTPGPYVVTGLANGTAYTFNVKAVNVVGPGAATADSAPTTPTAPPGLTVPPEMPIYSRGLPIFAPGDGTPSQATNVAFGDTLRTFPSEPSTGSPVGISIDISTIADAVKASTWVVLRNSGRPSWNRTGALGLGDTGSQSLIRNYKLRAHAGAGGGAAPAIGDGGWVDLVTVTNNRFSDRIHAVNLTGYNWWQLYVTDTTGNSDHHDVEVQIELHDVSDGTDDSLMIYGDSMVVEGLWWRQLSGSPYPSGRGPLEQLLEELTGRDRPAIWMMAEGNYNSGTSIATFGGQPEYQAILDANPCRNVYMQWGIADMNLVGADLNTLSPAGTASTPAQTWKTRVQNIINYGLAHGKDRFFLPHHVASHNNSYTKPNIIIMNELIDELADENPGTVFVGPDLFTFFDAHPNAFYDTLHPSYEEDRPDLTGDNLSGYEHMLETIAEWLAVNWYGVTLP